MPRSSCALGTTRHDWDRQPSHLGSQQHDPCTDGLGEKELNLPIVFQGFQEGTCTLVAPMLSLAKFKILSGNGLKVFPRWNPCRSGGSNPYIVTYAGVYMAVHSILVGESHHVYSKKATSI